jgi:hypothetical protein
VKRSIGGAALLFVSVLATPGLGGARRDGVQVDVSNLRGTQSETTIAVDPPNPSVLLAGSNDHRSLHATAYSSTDGGASWTAARAPLPPDSDFSGDPIVAIDREGRQYFGYVSVSQINRRTARFGQYVP